MTKSKANIFGGELRYSKGPIFFNFRSVFNLSLIYSEVTAKVLNVSIYIIPSEGCLDSARCQEINRIRVQ
jgi:hypothetical protein